MRSGAARRPVIPVDAHVHVHACFDPDRFLDRAADNFGKVTVVDEEAPALRGILLLTESCRDHAFGRFREQASRREPTRWTFRATAESCSLIARDPAGFELVLVGGRQVATAEGLEVLALGCDDEFEDGRELRPTVQAVREVGALPVVPWGFGKWWFRRGRLVAALLDAEEPSSIFLGDNSGRPALGGRPPLFRRAAERGVRVLPGSDPLPFAGQERKVGRFGFKVFARPDLRRPAEWLKQRLLRPGAPVEPYGRPERVVAFVRDQLYLRLHQRRRRVAA